MADKNLFWNKTGAIIGLIAIVVAVGIGSISWYVNREKSTILNIERVNEILLTKPLDVKGLTSSYRYNDSIEVKYLWQTTFVIRNTGDKTIYGNGFPEQSIRGSYIPLLVDNCDNVLLTTITNENNEAKMIAPLQLSITQWKPKEYVEITILTDGIDPPNLKISDRDIKDAKTTYSVYSLEEVNKNKKWIEYLPKGLASFLKWMVVITMICLLFAAIWGINAQITNIGSKGQKITTIIVLLIFMVILLCPILWIF